MIPLLLCLLSSAFAQSTGHADRFARNRIQPYSENSSYWQYKGKPVLLLGATSDDNLFQWGPARLEAHLDSLARVGGNYVRNTMSDRDPQNLRAFFRDANGKYDLNRWNEDYWNRFENFLKQTHRRKIIVQIEVWDRFDHSRDSWTGDPYNPVNNVNYSSEESGLQAAYPAHPGQNKQPFFFTVPDLDDNQTVLHFQQRFVDKMLSISLNFDHVLYCMDNETSGEVAWATYWADYIRSAASRLGKGVCLTEMWDHWDVTADTHKRTLDHPNRYDFIDISQNSQIPGYANWANAQYVFDYIKTNPRPINSTKIYGSETARDHWKERGITEAHALASFCRNLVGGFASSRFHRPPSGLGLSGPSMGSIQAIREIESLIKFWEVRPRMDLLLENDRNEAYLTAREGENYLVYFTDGGQVKLNLSGEKGRYVLRWIKATRGEWERRKVVKAGSQLELRAPGKEGWFAVLTKR